MTEPSASSVPPIRAALVGHGSASRVFHVPLLRASPDFSLTAAMSRNPETATALPEARIFTDLGQLLEDSDAELVVIATPNRTHAELARQALRAGRHVLLEKPMALTLAETQELVDLAAACGRVLTVFQNRRWDGDFQTVQALLDRGELGDVAVLRSHFDRFRPEIRDRWRESGEPGAGIWYDLGPHLVDQALTLFGRPQRVRADLVRLRPGALSDDHAEVTLDYSPDGPEGPGPSGGSAGERRVVLHASMLSARPAPRFTVHGSGGSFTIEGLDPQEAALLAGEVPGNPGWGEGAPDGELLGAAGDTRQVPRLPGDYPAFYRRLAAALRGEGPAPVTPEQALSTMQVIEAARRSQEQGGGWVSLTA